MFRTVHLSIISSFSLYTQQWYMSYRFADSLWVGSGLIWSCSQPVRHIPLLCVQWKTPVDGQRNCPKHVEVYSKNKFWEISASSWFYYKNLSRCTVTGTSNSYSISYACIVCLSTYMIPFELGLCNYRVSSQTQHRCMRNTICYV